MGRRQTPVGLLGLLGTAYWRITVTNTGPVGIEKAGLNDGTEPAVRAPPERSPWPPAQSRQFYCSTFLLLLPLKNTVTASYVPVNSPHGTKPTTTASSSAVACGLLCIL